MRMTREIIERTIELRKKLHSMPEASMNETKTKKVLMRFIGENTKLEITDKGKWFYVLKRAGKENAEAIAFRADMDAVCGKDGKPGHYCGHDGHSAILAGFAMWLDGVETDKDVYLIFQPAEETGKGAKICAGLLAEKNIKYIFGMHNIPGRPEKNILIRKGTFACASTGLEIAMVGTPSHAGYPEAGKNPGYALARLLLAVQELTARIKEEKGLCAYDLDWNGYRQRKLRGLCIGRNAQNDGACRKRKHFRGICIPDTRSCRGRGRSGRAYNKNRRN